MSRYDKDHLGSRMKRYEDVSRIHLTRRMPVIGRIDGRSFHTLTKGMTKPFEEKLIQCMWLAAGSLCKEIQGCKIAYVQSDEISVLLTDYDDLQTESWFASNLQKMASIAASAVTYYFNKGFGPAFPDINRPAMFDARFFTMPKEEVCNYFIWRQQDAIRNSVSMLAHSLLPHKRLQGLSSSQAKKVMLEEHNVNWESLHTYLKRGACLTKDPMSAADPNKLPTDIEFGPVPERKKFAIDFETPVFSENREYIERHI